MIWLARRINEIRFHMALAPSKRAERRAIKDKNMRALHAVLETRRAAIINDLKMTVGR